MNPIFSDKNFYVVCYDIVDDRRRNRVMKILKGYGFHVQKSVFECFLNSRQLETLKKRLLKEINEKEDSVRIYRYSQITADAIEILGLGELNIPESVEII